MTSSMSSHPRFARFFRRVAPAMDRGGLGDQRPRLLEGLAGQVLEVGAGEGRNLPHYPTQVDRLLAVEPEPLLREAARARAATARVPVEVVDGTAERLPADDASFDAAVVTCVLCSVHDPAVAVRELFRVLRPDGQLRFIEHVRADGAVAAAVQRGIDTTIWPRLFGGCHTGRDVLVTMTASGFRIDRVERLGLSATSIPFPAHPHVTGIAVRLDQAEHL